ncbi:trichohyalin-like [Spea bombifrons]|uniref:trichohyalin-like n=1 Tax=Spea bombifrons TaxID=233779 RepID=UPI002348EFB6|nr:trichohyalin-like [Spea bombifrons]
MTGQQNTPLGSKDHFLIEFEKCRSLKGKGQFRMQETPICDIIHYEDARWRPLSSGDRVLAPLESNAQQYGPGIVLQGAERRERSLDFESSGVLVTFWNGKTKRISPGLAVWIPQHMYDRISLELHIPLEARKKLVDSCFGYHRSSPCEVKEVPRPTSTGGSCVCLYCSPDHGLCQRCHLPKEELSTLMKSLSLISMMSSIKEKTAKEKDERKSKKQEGRSEVTHRRERKADKKKRGATSSREKQRVGSPSESQEEYLLCYKEKQKKKHASTQCTPTQSEIKPAAAASGCTMGSSYRGPPTSTGDTTHLQKTLHCIEKAMKEDRLAMEAAIRESRPRTAPLTLSHDLKARKSQELKDQKEATKVNLWGMRSEEREKRKQEKVQEMEERERMLQESRRLKSDQRIQLDLERRLDREGLEAQQAEARRAAAEERYLKQKQAAQEELLRDHQRVQFWAERRKERELQDMKQIQRSHREKEEERKVTFIQPRGNSTWFLLPEFQTRMMLINCRGLCLLLAPETFSKELQQNRMTERMRERDGDVHGRHRRQQLPETSKRSVSKRLEQFYQQVERETQKDRELHEYLTERNLQALRSAKLP